MTDIGEKVTVQCDENGNFDQPRPWPSCRPPTCTADDRPVETRNLTATTTEDTNVNDYLEYTCAGGNVTNEGRSILLECVGNHEFISCDDAWPDCRAPEICRHNKSTPVISTEAKLSGLECDWDDTEEFLVFECKCSDPMRVLETGAEHPHCRRGGTWNSPLIWPLCKDPPRCSAAAGPARPINVQESGLVGTYADLLQN